MDSRIPAMYLPLLMPGLGIQPPAGQGPLESSVSLQRHIALVGEAAHGEKPGRRACDLGFALELATILRARWGWCWVQGIGPRQGRPGGKGLWISPCSDS